MNKIKLINILSGSILGAFILYITLRDGSTSNSIILIILAPLFYSYLNSLLTSIIAPELDNSEPEFDRYSDSDGEF